MIAGGDDVGAEVEELFGDGGGEAEAAGGVFAVDDEEVDGVGFEDVGEVLMHDVAAGGAEDIADEENVHWTSLYGLGVGPCILAMQGEDKALRSFSGEENGINTLYMGHNIGGNALNSRNDRPGVEFSADTRTAGDLVALSCGRPR